MIVLMAGGAALALLMREDRAGSSPGFSSASAVRTSKPRAQASAVARASPADLLAAEED